MYQQLFLSKIMHQDAISQQEHEKYNKIYKIINMFSLSNFTFTSQLTITTFINIQLKNLDSVFFFLTIM